MTDATNPFRPVAAASDLPTTGDPAAVPTERVVSADTRIEAAVVPVETAVDAADAVAQETDLLEQLEADMAAVETAIATIERISTDGVGGEQTAVEIGAAVSIERFGAALEPDPAPPSGAPAGDRSPGPAFG